MGDDWIDLERVRRQAPKEESLLRPFRSLIVLIIIAAIAFFVLYKMARRLTPPKGDAGEIRQEAPGLIRPDASMIKGGDLGINVGGSQHKV